MSEFEFTLTVGLPPEEQDLDALVERLGAAGCDDALVGIGRRGRIGLEFSREADTAADALLGAIVDIRSAIPHASILEASPDLVGLTEVAGLLHVSRQNARKLLLESSAPAPPAVHEGRSPVWRLSRVLQWLREVKDYSVPPELLDVAAATMQVNIAVESHDALPDAQRAIAGALAGSGRQGSGADRAAEPRRRSP